jgi:glycine/D-amino acid oxidase-like deaminating enzyme
VRTTYGLECHGAILSETAASVDAYRLAHELIQHNANRGMKVYDQTEIETLNTTGSRPKAILKTGQTILAEKIVCCTGFESTLLLKEKVADLFYTYATISEQGIHLNKNVEHTLIWDTNEPYLYIRSTDDGRFIVGGEDANCNFQLFQQKTKERKAVKLQKSLEKLMPDVNFIEDFSWAGTFGTTKDGLPYIGASPEYDNTLFVLGFGGNGITFSVQGMEMIVAFLAGKSHPLAEYYRFGR